MIKKYLNKLFWEIEKRRPTNPILWRPLFWLKDSIQKILLLIRGRRVVIIKIKENIYFIHNPKAGGSSIKNSFHKSDIYAPIQKLKNKESFSFVRNPYDRVVSCYMNRIKNMTETKTGVIKGMKANYWKFKGKFYPNMSFNEFVKSIYSISDKKSDVHFQSQYYYLSDKKGNIIPNYIGRFENLEKDFEKVCKKIGINPIPKLPKKNVSKRKKDFMSYYDEETKKLVQERYAKDFEVFGYDR